MCSDLYIRNQHSCMNVCKGIKKPLSKTKWVYGIYTNHILIAILFHSLKSQVEEALKGNQLPTAKDFRKFSQNYQISKRVSVPGIDPISAKVEGNVIFDPNSYVPKETMLKTTLHAYGFHPSDVFEVQQLSKTFSSIQLLSFSFLFSYNNFLWIMYFFYKPWEKSLWLQGDFYLVSLGFRASHSLCDVTCHWLDGRPCWSY